MLTLRTGLLAAGLLTAGLLQTACSTNSENNASAPVLSNADALAQVVTSLNDEDRARDQARHPAATLHFMRVVPGMTVAEGLPGSGWYTRILANHLGKDGTLYGVNYADRMWEMFSWATPEWVAERLAASDKFPEQVASFTDNGVNARGFTFESVPPEVVGTIDRVLLIRALHNLNRFEATANTRSQALTNVHSMLKPDGLVGVVQHRAPESADNAGATGTRGYLKQSAVVSMFEDAGFELVASREINANPKDKPGADDIVWRLPPSLRGAKEGTPERQAAMAIGESDRMTLLFRKAQ